MTPTYRSNTSEKGVEQTTPTRKGRGFSAVMTPETFMRVFKGSDVAHGRTTLTGRTNERGKAEAKCWTVHKPADLADYTAHLEGRCMLGMPPIDSRDECRWGAIDVDEYESPSTEVLALISQRSLPLVPFRSKSGGLHLYLFMDEPVPAEWMMGTLETMAAGLGLSRCEIFPKQRTISKEDGTHDVGNWLNLPYFGEQRWAIDPLGQPVSPDDFMAKCFAMNVMNRRQLEDKVLRPEDKEFPDGPPCLNAIFGRKAEQGMRNIALSNLAVYMKRAHPDSWKERIHEYNRRYQTPLDRSEVEGTIVRSHSKKEYKYQCGTEPLCRFCDSQTCRQRKYGVGTGTDSIAANRSLTMVNTQPPIWYLDIVREDGSSRRISLTTEELQVPAKFQLRAMEVLQEMPALPGKAEWQQMVAALLKRHNVVEIPPEATAQGIFREELGRFFERAVTDSMSGVLRGMPYDDGEYIWFKMTDVLEYMANRKIVKLDQRLMQLEIREMGAMHSFRKVDRRGVNLWKLAKRNNDE